MRKDVIMQGISLRMPGQDLYMAYVSSTLAYFSSLHLVLRTPRRWHSQVALTDGCRPVEPYALRMRRVAVAVA